MPRVRRSICAPTTMRDDFFVVRGTTVRGSVNERGSEGTKRPVVHSGKGCRDTKRIGAMKGRYRTLCSTRKNTTDRWH